MDKCLKNLEESYDIYVVPVWSKNSSLPNCLDLLIICRHPFFVCWNENGGDAIVPWKRVLAYITGSVSEDLLRRIEYLLEENRVLRNQIQRRILLTDTERRILAEKAVPLGKLMADTVTIVSPATILKWHRTLVAQKV